MSDFVNIEILYVADEVLVASPTTQVRGSYKPIRVSPVKDSYLYVAGKDAKLKAVSKGFVTPR